MKKPSKKKGKRSSVIQDIINKKTSRKANGEELMRE